MDYLTSHWSYDPFLIVVAVIAAWHEIGLRGLALRSRPERTRQRRLRSLWFYAGLVVLLLTVQSPVDYWSSSYFYVHMIQHLLLSFAAPTLVVAGAPWQPLMDALPAQWGKHLVRSVALGRWSRPVRAAGRAVAQPWVAVVAFNATMIAWHVPVLYDLAEHNEAVHVWLMHGSLFVTGVLFWLQFISSPPVRVRLRPAAQIAALTGTNVAMWFLAMSMSIFTTTSWYAVYAHVPGVTLPPFADQQIGAAILWVCGDFWCYPAVGLIIRRMIDRDGASATVDRILRGSHTRRRWATRP
ncbi:MAG: cytochrome c oxidase assembly protein [Actinomycetota bacterium]